MAKCGALPPPGTRYTGGASVGKLVTSSQRAQRACDVEVAQHTQVHARHANGDPTQIPTTYEVDEIDLLDDVKYGERLPTLDELYALGAKGPRQ